MKIGTGFETAQNVSLQKFGVNSFFLFLFLLESDASETSKVLDENKFFEKNVELKKIMADSSLKYADEYEYQIRIFPRMKSKLFSLVCC